METGVVPPNLHYYNPRDGVEALVAGRLKVHFKIPLLKAKEFYNNIMLAVPITTFTCY